jgi:hypothetical protein
MLNKPSLAVSCLALLVTSGCVVVDDGPGPVYYGDLDIVVLFDGQADPNDCEYYQIDYVNIDIYDSSGAFVVNAQPICEEFGALFVDLPVDSYSVDLQLFDYAGGAATDLVRIQESVYRDERIIAEVDFQFN